MNKQNSVWKRMLEEGKQNLKTLGGLINLIDIIFLIGVVIFEGLTEKRGEGRKSHSFPKGKIKEDWLRSSPILLVPFLPLIIVILWLAKSKWGEYEEELG